LEAGFYEGRSPDVLAVAGSIDVAGGSGLWSERTPIPWPSRTPDTRVPIVFSGAGVRRDVTIPDGTGLEQIAPTIAQAIGLHRPFPGVPSGQAVAGITTGLVPKLVVEVALTGVGTRDLQSVASVWPTLRRLLHTGAATVQGTTGSVPVDPAASLTTIGTGGLPSEHGITGSLLRNGNGLVTAAWSPAAPIAVISTLPEDLDERRKGKPLVGLVETAATDRGIVGGAWYPNHDRDLIARASDPATVALRVADLLERGFGRDRVPDLLAIVMRGRMARMDADLGRIISDARRAAGGSVLFVVAGTGSAAVGSVDGDEVAAAVTASAGPVVAAAVPGGLFLDQLALAAGGTTSADATEALAGIVGGDGDRLMADAFQSYAVSFGRYC
jgi:hypothetical protein